MSWAQRHPGELAARLLQQMEDRVGRDGEAGSWAKDDMPAAAKSYYIRVLRVAHAAGGLRNLREMATLCHILDHVAKKRYKTAADVAGQRLKAVEAAIVDSNWDRAQFLELVEQEDPLLAERSERHMSTQELAFKQRLAGKGSWLPSGSGWSAAGAGYGGSSKGYGKKGKDKGKENGKGKGGKGQPDRQG